MAFSKSVQFKKYLTLVSRQDGKRDLTEGTLLNFNLKSNIIKSNIIPRFMTD